MLDTGCLCRLYIVSESHACGIVSPRVAESLCGVVEVLILPGREATGRDACRMSGH